MGCSISAAASDAALSAPASPTVECHFPEVFVSERKENESSPAAWRRHPDGRRALPPDRKHRAARAVRTVFGNAFSAGVRRRTSSPRSAGIHNLSKRFACVEGVRTSILVESRVGLDVAAKACPEVHIAALEDVHLNENANSNGAACSQDECSVGYDKDETQAQVQTSITKVDVREDIGRIRVHQTQRTPCVRTETEIQAEIEIARQKLSVTKKAQECVSTDLDAGVVFDVKDLYDVLGSLDSMDPENLLQLTPGTRSTKAPNSRDTATSYDRGPSGFSVADEPEQVWRAGLRWFGIGKKAVNVNVNAHV
jgi:hypothetical protein